MRRVTILFLLVVLPAWLMNAAAQVQSVGVAGDGEFTRITIMSETPMRPDVFLRETEDGLIIEMVPETFALTHEQIGRAHV